MTYEQWEADILRETRRWNLRVWVEPAVLFMAIVALCVLLGFMQQRDDRAKQEDKAKDRQAICQSVNMKYANDICRLNQGELHV
jgi:hypothetical protein